MKRSRSIKLRKDFLKPVNRLIFHYYFLCIITRRKIFKIKLFLYTIRNLNKRLLTVLFNKVFLHLFCTSVIYSFSYITKRNIYELFFTF